MVFNSPDKWVLGMNWMWLVRRFENQSPGSEGVAVNGVPGFVLGPGVIPKQGSETGPFYFLCLWVGAITENTLGEVFRSTRAAGIQPGLYEEGFVRC